MDVSDHLSGERENASDQAAEVKGDNCFPGILFDRSVKGVKCGFKRGVLASKRGALLYQSNVFAIYFKTKRLRADLKL